MPKRDPVDQVMATLRGHGTTDHNGGLERQAQMMKQQRGKMGVAPGPPHPARGRKQPAGGAPAGAAPGRAPGVGPEAGPEGGIGLPEEHDVPGLAIDQMNELILTLKVAMHQSQDEEEKAAIEQEINQVRQMVQQKGGEPIWAHETIEQGLQKLTGQGWMGRDRLSNILGHYGERLTEGYPLEEIAADAFRGVTEGAQRLLEGPEQRDLPHQTPTGTQLPEGDVSPPYYGDPEPPAPRYDPDDPAIYDDEVYAEEGLPRETHPADPDVRTEVDPDYVDYGVAVDEVDDYHRTVEEGVPDPEPEDELSQVLADAGALEAWMEDREEPVAPWDDPEAWDVGVDTPDPIIDEEYIRNLMTDPDMEPMTDEEIRQAAHDVVQRQAVPKKQQIQRELDKFRRGFPNEFRKAKDDLHDAAADYRAEAREEFTGRGLLYSSILGEDFHAVDDAVMTQISEISRDAAERVMGLEDELRDVAQWAIVEEEATVREMEADRREEQQWLAQFRMNAALQFDQANLDRMYKEFTMEQQQMMQAIEFYDRQYQQYQEEGQYMAMAMMANEPGIANELRRQGLTPEMITQMQQEDPTTLAQLVGQGIEQMERSADLALTEAQTAATMSQARLNDAQVGLAGAQARLADAQLDQALTEAEDADEVMTEYDAEIWHNYALPLIQGGVEGAGSIERLIQADDRETLQNMLPQLRSTADIMEADSFHRRQLISTIGRTEQALEQDEELGTIARWWQNVVGLMEGIGYPGRQQYR